MMTTPKQVEQSELPISPLPENTTLREVQAKGVVRNLVREVVTPDDLELAARFAVRAREAGHYDGLIGKLPDRHDREDTGVEL